MRKRLLMVVGAVQPHQEEAMVRVVALLRRSAQVTVLALEKLAQAKPAYLISAGENRDDAAAYLLGQVFDLAIAWGVDALTMVEQLPGCASRCGCLFEALEPGRQSMADRLFFEYDAHLYGAIAAAPHLNTRCQSLPPLKGGEEEIAQRLLSLAPQPGGERGRRAGQTLVMLSGAHAAPSDSAGELVRKLLLIGQDVVIYTPQALPTAARTAWQGVSRFLTDRELVSQGYFALDEQQRKLLPPSLSRRAAQWEGLSPQGQEAVVDAERQALLSGYRQVHVMLSGAEKRLDLAPKLRSGLTFAWWLPLTEQAPPSFKRFSLVFVPTLADEAAVVAAGAASSKQVHAVGSPFADTWRLVLNPPPAYRVRRSQGALTRDGLLSLVMVLLATGLVCYGAGIYLAWMRNITRVGLACLYAWLMMQYVIAGRVIPWLKNRSKRLPAIGIALGVALVLLAIPLRYGAISAQNLIARQNELIFVPNGVVTITRIELGSLSEKLAEVPLDPGWTREDGGIVAQPEASPLHVYNQRGEGLVRVWFSGEAGATLTLKVNGHQGVAQAVAEGQGVSMDALLAGALPFDLGRVLSFYVGLYLAYVMVALWAVYVYFQRKDRLAA